MVPEYIFTRDGVVSTCSFTAGSLLPDLPVSTPFTFAITQDTLVCLAFDKIGMWNPLGGHLDEGESWQEALVREAQEEGGIHVDPDSIQIIGWITITKSGDLTNNKYPPVSLLPITISHIAEFILDWTPMETEQRGLFPLEIATHLLKQRYDNDQMLRIFTNHIISRLSWIN